MKICIDAGHGGSDPGAINVNKFEKDINLALALKIGYLISDKFDVHYTRKSDVYIPLGSRCQISNSAKANYFISIHVNSAENKSASGIETYIYNVPNEKAFNLAKNIQTNLIKATGAKDRGVKTASYHVLKCTKAPAVLVEVGFISNDEESNKLITEDYQDKLSHAIADAIMLIA